MPKADYYILLGVARDASMDAVRAAYRAAAKRLHPDTNPSPDSAARFAAVAEAYEVLCDRVKRRAYDASCNGGARGRTEDIDDRPMAQGHYAWVNVATARGETPPDVSEFDELYETFFSPKRGKTAPESTGKGVGAKKRTGRA